VGQVGYSQLAGVSGGPHHLVQWVKWDISHSDKLSFLLCFRGRLASVIFSKSCC